MERNGGCITALYQQVERFRKKRGSMAMRDLEAAEKSYEEVCDEIIDRIPLKVRIRGLTPEQRLEGLTPGQLADLLTPEQRLEGLTPGQLADLLTPEQRLEGLTPEQRLEGLTPKQRMQLAKLLTSDPTPNAHPPARRDQIKKKRRH